MNANSNFKLVAFWNFVLLAQCSVTSGTVTKMCLTIPTKMSCPYQVVRELIDFFKTGRAHGSITNSTKLVDERTLRIIAIHLLPWLKRLLKPHSTSLQLTAEYPWCRALEKLIREDEAFKALLVSEGKTAIINPAISSDEIKKIQELCAASYNPPLMR